MARGAELTRPVADYPYGRSGVIFDPYGHRWMVTTPPARATRARHGDAAYLTIAAPDADRAVDFYGAVLEWVFTPEGRAGEWRVANTTLRTRVQGGRHSAEVWPRFRVADLDAAVRRVRYDGGRADGPTAGSPPASTTRASGSSCGNHHRGDPS